ncbi:replication-relaxation family protein [Dactylosporangium sp. CS-047395]|uniref:replication-relaxation family protein n=1 Tax=Dactylosporangium sp. CS-047395 TaxID=3239936 RepID=UPI003D8FCD78
MAERLLLVQARLTARDFTLLGWLADHGVLTSSQIAEALFPSINYAQRRLRELRQDDLIDRFRPQRQDGGSYPYHYVLGQLGADVISAQRGDDPPRRDRARKRRWYLTNRANLPHLLGVNGFFTQLAGHARTHPGTALERWWSAGRCQEPYAFIDVPTARVPQIRPDGHGVWRDGSRELSFFVEYDTGTEPLPVLVDKMRRYVDLSGVTGRRWPVLFALQSPRRELHLHQRLTDVGSRYPVATTAEEDPAGAVWWRHRREGPRTRLIDI